MRLYPRPMQDDDTAAVLDLVNADHLPGQPLCTRIMLARARAGRSPVDTAAWAELGPVAVDVVDTPAGDPAGVVSYARRPRDGAGVVLWLHGREDPEVVGVLVDHALAQLEGASVVDAFPFGTALGLGLEALPVQHRRATQGALLDRGFDGRDRWDYLCRRLPAPDLMPRGAAVRLSPVEEGKRRLSLHSGKQKLGEATVGVPVDGIGVLWWIEVDPTTRGHGVGRTLLGCALDLLTRAKAHEVVLCVDNDNLATEGDRAAARALYEAAGFEEVDRLASFHRGLQSESAGRTVGGTVGRVP